MILLSSIFKQSREEVKNRYHEIYTSQNTQFNSPNFFYKGEPYILIKGPPVNPLRKDLREHFESALIIDSQIEGSYKKLQYLLFDFLRDNRASDLYTLFPKDAHSFLEGINYPEEECELPDSVEEIRNIVREQLLNSLL
jgi:hypothetical protein